MKGYKKLYISLGLILLLILGGIWAYRFLNGENQGEVKTPEIEAALKKTQADKTPTLLSLNTDYIFIKYSDVYTDVRNLGPDNNSLERYQLLAPSVSLGSKSIVITIKNLPDGGLDNETAYDVRKRESDIYKETSKNIRGEQVVYMQKNDGSEVTFFSVHKNWLGIIALTSRRANDNLMNETSSLADSMEWQK